MPSDQFHRVEKLTGECENWRYIGQKDNPSFTGTINWSNRGVGSDPLAAFYKDPFNIVRIKGVINTGTNNESAWTLPEGYRPPDDMLFPVLQTGAVEGAYVYVATGGTVTISHSGATGSKDIWLNNISFRV
jgi:hypothetical protein